MATKTIAASVAALVFVLACGEVRAQAPGAQAPAASDAALPAYKPPLRGAPGGRTGAASRGAESAALPTLEPLAPDRVTGQTALPAPTLYYFIAKPSPQPLKVTIREPNVARLLLDTNIPAPRAAGIQPVRLSDYGVQLQPGVTYVWTVALVVDPATPSKNVVASATILRAALEPAVDSAARAAPPLRRAAVLAQAGFWYDALAAAVDGEAGDRHAALDALLAQVGLADAANADRQAAGAR